MKGMFIYSTSKYSQFTTNKSYTGFAGYNKHMPSVCRDTK